MLSEALAMEHYRLHVIEQWPDGPDKNAALGAVRSTLEGLLRRNAAGVDEWACLTCGAGRAAHSLPAAA